MSDGSVRAGPRSAARRAPLTVDVVALTPLGRRLGVLLVRPAAVRAKERWEIPWQPLRADDTLEDRAARVVRGVPGDATAAEQVGAFGDRRRHPSGAPVSVAFLALVPGPAPVTDDAAWFPVDALPSLPPRHRAMVDAALHAVRARLDQSPIAFRLLPPTFTLGQLQDVYEVLLGRRLHKASFRRALHAAWLVEPTDEWRHEGRGRPAQLFRYQPRKRRSVRRGVRFDALGG